MDDRQQRPRQDDGTNTIMKWIIIVLVIIAVVVIVVLIAVYAAGGAFSSSSSKSTTEWPGYGSGGGGGGGSGQSFTKANVQQLTPKESKSGPIATLKEVCKKYKKKLPVPRTDFDVKQLIDTIKTYHQDTECDSYATGVTLDPEVRYESLDGKTKWPSLSSGGDAGKPKEDEDRDCITVVNEQTELTKPTECDNMTFPCLLMHNETGNCQVESQAKCILVDRFTDTQTSLMEAWKAAAAKQTKGQNILLIDRDYIIEDSLQNANETTDCSALEVKYKFSYIDSYTKSANKAFKLDAKQDPEFECVHIVGDMLKVSRVSCEDAGCPICF